MQKRTHIFTVLSGIRTQLKYLFLLVWQKINQAKKRRSFNIKNSIIATAGFLLGVFFVWFFLLRGDVASAAWWDNTWKYRKSVAVSNSTTALTDYQIVVTMDTATLVTAGKMQSDCDDIRIVDQTGKQYSYWLEPSTCNTSATKIWAKVPSIPATGGLFYVYYGNSSAGSMAKNPSDIFIQEIDNVGAAWLLDESAANTCTGGVNDSCDSSSGNYNLSWGTATSSTTGKISNGLNFDGTDNATANINDTFTPVTSSKRWAVSMWFKTSDTQGYLFDSGDAGNLGERVAVYISAANTLSLYMSQDTIGTAYRDLGYSVTSTDNTWHYLVVTRDGDNSVKLYVDGSPITVSVTTTNVDMSAYSESWVDFTLGHRYVMNIYNYNGIIDEARVYSDSLTATEISTLYGDGTNRHGYVTSNYPGKELIRQYSANISVGSPGNEEIGPGPAAYWRFDEGTGTSVNDSSGSNYTGNLGAGSSAPAWKPADFCVNGSCLQFDGTDDSIDFGDTLDFTGNTEMTVSAWVKMLEIPGGRAHIISKYDAGTAGQWYLAIDGDSKVTFLRECGLYGETGVTPVALNTWNHVVGVYDGTNIQVYLNGILDKTAVDSCSISNTSVDVKIGAGENGTGTEDHFSGFIDEVKVYPYARTADEIKQDYLFSSAEGASVVLGASDQAFLTDGLLGYWKMDETTGSTGPSWTTADSSGSGNNGTGVGNATTGEGKFGRGGNFDGSGDYTEVATGYTLDLTEDLTLSAWIKTSDTVNNDYIVSKYRAVWAKRGYALITTAGKLQMLLGTEYDSATSITSNATVATGEWVHVAGSIGQDNVMKLYVNGTLDNSGQYSGTRQSVDTDVQIGAYGDSELQNSFFNGSIDEVRIYGRELSPNEMKTLYNWAPGPVAYYKFDDGTGTSSVIDSSGNDATGTIEGTVSNTNWVNGKYGGAYNFNSVSIESTDAMSIAGQSQFTVSAWVFPRVVTGTSRNLYLECIGSSCSTRVAVNINSSGGLAINARDDDSDGSTVNCLTDSRVLPTNEWVHVAAVYDSDTNTHKAYINGVPYTDSGSGGCNNPFASGVNSSNKPKIGSNYNGTNNFFDGYIDDYKMYHYARSASQIIEDMNAGHPAVGTPVGSTVLHLRLDEGYGTTAHDSSPQENNSTISGSTWTNDGKSGKGMSFNGTSGYINAGSDSSLDNLSTVTVSAWIYPTGYGEGNFGRIVNKSNTSSTNWALTLVNDSSQQSIRFFKERDTASNATQVTAANGSIQLNHWYHVVGVYDENATPRMRLFINGAEASYAEQIEGTGSPDTDASYDLSIGNRLGEDRTFQGTIDEVKIYPFALSAEQIKLDIQEGKSMVLGAQSTGVGGTSPSNSSDRSYCVPGDTGTCSAPVFELNFEEATGQTAYDTSTNENNGTLGASSSVSSDDPTWGLGPDHMAGSALEFDGTNDFVEIDGDEHVMTGTEFTVSAWFKSGDTGTARRTIYNEGSEVVLTYTNMFISLNDGEAGRIRAFLRDEDTSAADILYSGGYNDNTWHFVSFVKRSASSHELYVDGALVGTSSTTIDGPYDSITAQTVGRREQELAEGDYFVGTIDQVKTYDYARTPAQIAWDYSKGAPIAHYRLDECQGTTAYNTAFSPSGAAGNNGTINAGSSGNTSVGTCASGSSTEMWANGEDGQWNASLDFDEVDDRIVLPDMDYGQETTISYWFNSTDIAGTGYQYMFSHGGFQVANSINIYFNEDDNTVNTPGTILVSVMDSDDNPPLLVDDNQTQIGLSDSEWHHLAVVINSAGTKAYVDGVQQVSYANGNNGINPSGSIYFGSRYDLNSARFYDGKLDDLQIYNYAMTPAQVKEMYKGGAVVFK